MQAALARSAKARAYLEARCIPLEVAQAQGVGYLPPEAAKLPELRTVQKWVDRVIFPLSSPDGRGYSGRTLSGWQPGMDENEHKALLEIQEETAAPRRYLQTFPAGWFGLGDHSPKAEQLILVEGAFDRLALIAAGVAAPSVVAVGKCIGARAEWIPAQITHVLLAFDRDTGGRRGTGALHRRLQRSDVHVTVCTPPDDGLGKDWSERWRHGAHEAVRSVFEALDQAA